MSRRLLERGRLQDFFNPKVLFHSRKPDTIFYCYGWRIAQHRTLKWKVGVRYSKPNGDRTDLLPPMHACLRQSGNMFLDYAARRLRFRRKARATGFTPKTIQSLRSTPDGKINLKNHSRK